MAQTRNDLKQSSDEDTPRCFCRRKFAEAVGLRVPKVEIFRLKGKPYYLVERYDRKREESGIIRRLHQEDFCQAMRSVYFT